MGNTNRRGSLKRTAGRQRSQSEDVPMSSAPNLTPLRQPNSAGVHNQNQTNMGIVSGNNHDNNGVADRHLSLADGHETPLLSKQGSSVDSVSSKSTTTGNSGNGSGNASGNGRGSRSQPPSPSFGAIGTNGDKKYLKPSHSEIERSDRKSHSSLILDYDHPYLQVENGHGGTRTRQLSLLERKMKEQDDMLTLEERRMRERIMEQHEGLKDWQYSILNDLGDKDRVKQYYAFVMKPLRQGLSKYFEGFGDGAIQYVPPKVLDRVIKVEADKAERVYMIILAYLSPPPRRTKDDLRRSGLL